MTDPLRGSVEVLLNRGDGSFHGAPAEPLGGTRDKVAAGDFDGDGIEDLVTSSRSPDGKVSIHWGLGEGRFR
jgi:hypothetical protein